MGTEVQAAAPVLLSEGGKKDTSLFAVSAAVKLNQRPAPNAGLHESHQGTLNLPQACSKRWPLNRLQTQPWSQMPRGDGVPGVLRMPCALQLHGSAPCMCTMSDFNSYCNSST